VYNPCMKSARLFTTVGSIVLFLSALLHGSGYPRIAQRVQSAGIQPPLEGLLKALWLTFSVQFIAIAIITFVARDFERGSRIILLCAACLAIEVAITFHFLGPFIGGYLISVVALLFLIGGWLQFKQQA